MLLSFDFLEEIDADRLKIINNLPNKTCKEIQGNLEENTKGKSDYSLEVFIRDVCRFHYKFSDDCPFVPMAEWKRGSPAFYVKDIRQEKVDDIFKIVNYLKLDHVKARLLDMLWLRSSTLSFGVYALFAYQKCIDLLIEEKQLNDLLVFYVYRTLYFMSNLGSEVNRDQVVQFMHSTIARCKNILGEENCPDYALNNFNKTIKQLKEYKVIDLESLKKILSTAEKKDKQNKKI